MQTAELRMVGAQQSLELLNSQGKQLQKSMSHLFTCSNAADSHIENEVKECILKWQNTADVSTYCLHLIEL